MFQTLRGVHQEQLEAVFQQQMLDMPVEIYLGQQVAQECLFRFQLVATLPFQLDQQLILL